MKLPLLYTELYNKTTFRLTPIIDVLKDLDVNAIEPVFKKELYAWMGAVLENRVYLTTELTNIITDYIQDGKITFHVDYRKEVGFFNYLQVVLQELQILYDNKLLDYNLSQKAAALESYLLLNEQRFKELDTLIRITKMKGIYKDCREIANLTIKKPYIDMVELNTQLQRLFWYKDRNYLLKLLHPNNYQEYINRENSKEKQFNYNYYKNPPIYEADKKEKEIYLRFLKAWILENIEKRKTLLNWNVLPEEYQKLSFYALSLLPGVDIRTLIDNQIKNSHPKTVQEINYPTTKSVQVIDYPKYIFLNQQAFQLFNLLLKYCSSHSTISFVYRMMAEKENPPLIVAKDSPFRTWFNEQTYSLKLETHTKTYENAKNDDRISLYKLAKQMIYSKS